MTEQNGRRPGALVIIGGHEDKEGDREILREVAGRLNGGKLVLATIASHEPEGYIEAYEKGFTDLGISEIVELYVQDRTEAQSAEKLRILDGAAGVFFSGGDQLRITSQIGQTPIERRVREIYEAGGVIAGTSAGASMMSDIMLVRGPGRESYRIGELETAPGLAFLQDVIIDQHFAERGRIGRLLGAVAQNPRILGIGIDEDTAIVVEDDRCRVLGAGGVYIVDGEGVTSSNIAEGSRKTALSIHDVRLHVLSAGEDFDLKNRRPIPRIASSS